MRSVTTKPPTTFKVARKTARNPRTTSAVPWASPMMVSAPTSTMPWMALDPDISGVCRMLGTFETTSIPTKAARTKMVRYSTIPVVEPPIGVDSSSKWITTVLLVSRPAVPPSSSTAAGATAAPSRSTHMPATISSSQSGASVPSGPIRPSTLATLRAKRKLAWVGMPEGGLAMPTTCTPLWSTTSPATVSSQLPPWSAAMSTTTAPSAMPSTIDVVNSTGALRPGTAAVVMTTSERPTSSASAARWRSSSSGVSSRA